MHLVRYSLAICYYFKILKFYTRSDLKAVHPIYNSEALLTCYCVHGLEEIQTGNGKMEKIDPVTKNPASK